MINYVFIIKEYLTDSEINCNYTDSIFGESLTGEQSKRIDFFYLSKNKYNIK